MYKIIRQSTYLIKNWKNGLGKTAEILVYPNTGQLDYLWRFSMADIVDSGPFSCFPGFFRQLVLLEGEPIELKHVSIDGNVKQSNLKLLEPYFFDGADSTSATINKPGRDFNFIYSSSLISAVTVVEKVHGDRICFLSSDWDQVLLFVVSGSLKVSGEILHVYDSIFIESNMNLPPICADSDTLVIITKISFAKKACT